MTSRQRMDGGDEIPDDEGMAKLRIVGEKERGDDRLSMPGPAAWNIP